MELPAPLRAAVDTVLDGTPLAALQGAAAQLSRRYRAEVRDGRLHLDETTAVKAYLATRLPATYAAVRSAMDSTAETLPAFSPRTQLDLGAGPGTALWAATDCWNELESARLIEASDPAREIGRHLAAAQPTATEWIAADLSGTLPDLAPADLVTVAYVLDELAPVRLPALIDTLWSLTQGVLLVVEPGTPAGWARILLARERLIGAGAAIVAPCPHLAPCPLAAPDWCHFARRVARSRIHRLAKEADVPWEDEKFIYLAASRLPPSRRVSRVLAPPRSSSGKVELKLCQADGRLSRQIFSKRDGAAFKAARRADWGDALG